MMASRQSFYCCGINVLCRVLGNHFWVVATMRKKNVGPETPPAENCSKSLTVWGWIIPWTWTRIEGAGTWRLYRILLWRTHVGRAVAILGDKRAPSVIIRGRGGVRSDRHGTAEAPGDSTDCYFTETICFGWGRGRNGKCLWETSMFLKCKCLKTFYSLKPKTLSTR